MDPITKEFHRADGEVRQTRVHPNVDLREGPAQDDVTAEYLKKLIAEDGVLFVGKTQEKTAVLGTERRRNENTVATYPWLVRSTAMVNHFYVYCMDLGFGPFFLTDFRLTFEARFDGNRLTGWVLSKRSVELRLTTIYMGGKRNFERIENTLLLCAGLGQLCNNYLP